MSRIHGKSGDVFAASAELELCDDIWSEYVDAEVTASADTTDYKEGAASAKFVCPAIGLANGDIIASEAVVAGDITAYTDVLFWAKSSVNINTAADLQLLLDDHALCVSPTTVDVPVLVANTWKLCRVTVSLAGLVAVISVGAKLTANDPGAFSLWLDNIRAAKKVAGVKSWTLTQAVAVVETTGFDSAGAKTYLPGGSGWSGTFEGFKDAAPLTIGTVILLELRESATSTQQFRGQAIITSLAAKTDINGLVTYSYNFQGDRELTIPSA